MSTASASLPAAPPVLIGTMPRVRQDESFTFHDFVSIFNPLQHIPVVSTLYRAITGDTIKPFERIVGDTLYGGWEGCVSSVANLVYENETGKDFGDTVLAFVEHHVLGQAEPTEVASAAPATPDSQAGVLATTTTSTQPQADAGLRALLAYSRSGNTSAPLGTGVAL